MEEEWTLEHLAMGGADVNSIPGLADTLKLVDAYRSYWTEDRMVTLDRLVPWVCRKFVIDPQTFTWNDVHKAIKGEAYKMQRLEIAIEENGIEDDAVLRKLHDAADVVYSVADVIKHASRLMNNITPGVDTMRVLMPPELRTLDVMADMNESIVNHDPTKNNSFQNAFCHLRAILQGCGYRRSSGTFFKRILTPEGVETMAFEEDVTVVKFVSEHTSHDASFKAWRWITQPVANFDAMVKYLTVRPLSEAPDLVENLHLRSYAGDAFGRGAGVYNSYSDMFFPYALREQWQEIADEVQTLRRTHVHPEYVCKPPDATDVCVVHLQSAFPFDVLDEVRTAFGTVWWREVGSVPDKSVELKNKKLRAALKNEQYEMTRIELIAFNSEKDPMPVLKHTHHVALDDGRFLQPHFPTRWREADPFERRRRVLSNSEDVGKALHEALPMGEESQPVRVGRVWQQTARPGSHFLPGVRSLLLEGKMHLTDEELGDQVIPDDAYCDCSEATGLQWEADDGTRHGTVEFDAPLLYDSLSRGITTFADADEWKHVASGAVTLDGSEPFDPEKLTGSHFILVDDVRYFPAELPIWVMPTLQPAMRPRVTLRDPFTDLRPGQCVQHSFATGLKWRHVSKPTNGTLLVNESLTEALKHKLEFEQAEWDAFGITELPTVCHVKIDDKTYAQPVPTVRTFVRDTGRTWRDMETPELDQIYHCQEFTDHDRFFLYALKGRLFFEVGERDKHQMTVAWIGIGGSGKSTVIKALQTFWPKHLTGVLSSNMQANFGMASVLVDDYDDHLYAVAFCTEVSSELNLPQEEWQDSTEKTLLSLNRKFKTPIRITSKAQMAWAGNSQPKNYKNAQGQMSRRLAGCFLNKPVKPRDGDIGDKIKANAGMLQRRMIVAYDMFVSATGSIDPMSTPDKLPPAFADFYYKVRRESDPVEAFLSDGRYVKVAQGQMMLMAKFRELYNQYRLDNDMGKNIKWSEDAYKTPFADRGVSVTRKSRVDIDGEEHINVDVLLNLIAVA